jgi:hypothetical protein
VSSDTCSYQGRLFSASLGLRPTWVGWGSETCQRVLLPLWVGIPASYLSPHPLHTSSYQATSQTRPAYLCAHFPAKAQCCPGCHLVLPWWQMQGGVGTYLSKSVVVTPLKHKKSVNTHTYTP